MKPHIIRNWIQGSLTNSIIIFLSLNLELKQQVIQSSKRKSNVLWNFQKSKMLIFLQFFPDHLVSQHFSCIFFWHPFKENFKMRQKYSIKCWKEYSTKISNIANQQISLSLSLSLSVSLSLCFSLSLSRALSGDFECSKIVRNSASMIQMFTLGQKGASRNVYPRNM
jgi:hypothetical protein